jgi:hypothetical protein
MALCAANATPRVILGLASLVGVAALLLTVLSSTAAKTDSSASLLKFDSPCRKTLRAEVRGSVEKSALQDRARLVRHPVRPIEIGRAFMSVLREVIHVIE